MKFNVLAALTATAMLSACATIDLERVASDTLSQTISGVITNGGSTAKVGDVASNSVEADDVSVSVAKKTSRNLGKITVTKTEKNPQGQTKLILEGCSHPRIGNLRCGGYIFELTKEGWLVDDSIAFNDLNYPEVVIAAGNYYLKFHNWDSGFNRFATGEFEVKPFVTNYVFVELE